MTLLEDLEAAAKLAEEPRSDGHWGAQTAMAARLRAHATRLREEWNEWLGHADHNENPIERAVEVVFRRINGGPAPIALAAAAVQESPKCKTCGTDNGHKYETDPKYGGYSYCPDCAAGKALIARVRALSQSPTVVPPLKAPPALAGFDKNHRDRHRVGYVSMDLPCFYCTAVAGEECRYEPDKREPVPPPADVEVPRCDGPEMYGSDSAIYQTPCKACGEVHTIGRVEHGHPAGALYQPADVEVPRPSYVKDNLARIKAGPDVEVPQRGAGKTAERPPTHTLESTRPEAAPTCGRCKGTGELYFDDSGTMARGDLRPCPDCTASRAPR